MSRYKALSGQRDTYQLKASWNLSAIYDMMCKCIREQAILELIQINPSVEKILFKIAKEQNLSVIVGDPDEACSLPIVYNHHKVYSVNKLPDHHMTVICRWDVDSNSLPNTVKSVLVLKKIS